MRQPRMQLRRLQRFAGLRALAALDAFALNMTRGAAYGADRPSTCQRAMPARPCTPGASA